MSAQSTFPCPLGREDWFPENAGAPFDTNTYESRSKIPHRSDSRFGHRKRCPKYTCFATKRCGPSLRWPKTNTVSTNITNFLHTIESYTEWGELETRPSEVLNPPHVAQTQQEVAQTNLITTQKSDGTGILDGEIPPRRRDLHTLLGRAAECDQPPGAELPNLVSPNVLTIQDHLCVAKNRGPHN